MKDREIIDGFIKLRAGGFSFNKIAAKMGVSEKTLREWNKKYYSEIEKKIEEKKQELLNELAVSRNDRLRFLSEEFQKLRNELSCTEKPMLNYYDLVKMTLLINKEIDKFDADMKKNYEPEDKEPQDTESNEQ